MTSPVIPAHFLNLNDLIERRAQTELIELKKKVQDIHQMALPKKVSNYLLQTQKAIERCQDILDSLIELGQRSLTIQPVKLDELIKSCESFLKPLTLPHSFQVECKTSEPHVHLARGLIHQVLINLVHNAAKCMSEPGLISLSTETQPDWVLIHVDDSGPGIPDELISKIFEAGYSRTGSSGMGLFLCQQIVHQHRGTLIVSRSPRGGARFTLRLPTVTDRMITKDKKENLS